MRHVLRIALLQAALGTAVAAPAAAVPLQALEKRGPAVMPMAVPAPAHTAATGTWIVTARPGPDARRIAKRYHARRKRVPDTAIYEVSNRYAHPMIRALVDARVYVKAHPNTGASPTQAPLPPDPLEPLATWRTMVAVPTLIPPPVTPKSPLLAIIDSPLDSTHPEFAGGATRTLRPLPVRDSHGTSSAAIAGAPTNGVGIAGVWPGMRVLNIPLPTPDYACSDRVDAIGEAIRAHAAVIALEYGAPDICFAEYVAVQRAIGGGIVVIAGSGNTGATGNQPEYPGSLPHVLTVAAVGEDGRRAPFSTANPTVDLGAPGVGVLTAVRAGEPADPEGDGYAPVSGTSFAAPMVGAAVAWLSAVHPELGRSSLVFNIQLSARDTEGPGWDRNTGYGVLDVGTALNKGIEQNDPLEPNDDILWIDGRVFGLPDPTVGAGNHNQTFAALVDRYEDDADVYRVTVAPHSRARVTVDPRFGAVDIALYAPDATTIYSSRGRLDQSRRPGEATQRVVIANGKARARTYYVAVTARTTGTSLNSLYRFQLTRLRR